MARKKSVETGYHGLHRAETAERRPRGGDPLEEVGALPQRTAVGHGPRGLQRRRQRLGLLQPRPRALARLPLGRRRTGGICDDQQRLCFALALWNGKDPILKERLFGLTNSEGNHGEDVKEYYFYLDSTPTHSYMKYLYKYPQRAYPYGDLVETTGARSRMSPNTSCSTRECSTRTGTSTCSSNTPRNRPKTSWSRSRCTTGARSRPAPRAPDALVPQPLVLGRRSEAALLLEHVAGADRGGPSRSSANAISTATDAPELLFTENETNTERSGG